MSVAVSNYKEALEDMNTAYMASPEPSFKVTNYFPIYVQLFSHLRNTECTFVETGVLNGGSLFMKRQWLEPKARIIGIDLNPDARKWCEAGFEIISGDQGDPAFWAEAFKTIGAFDAFLDDGGHQSFQQIVTTLAAIRAAKSGATIVIEDTCTSFMREFSAHGSNSFLEFAKDATDVLTSNTSHFFEGEFPKVANQQSVDDFKGVFSIQFFSGMVAFHINSLASERPELIWNRQPTTPASDFRYNGRTSAEVVWPNPFAQNWTTITGGKPVKLKKFKRLNYFFRAMLPTFF